MDYRNNTLQQLVGALSKLKLRIQTQNAIKDELENEIRFRFGELPAEGTVHLYTEDGKQDITATCKLNYTLDAEAYWDRDKKVLPKNIAPIITKISLDMAAYRLLEKINPEAFAAMQVFVTTKPAKTSISFKDVKKK